MNQIRKKFDGTVLRTINGTCIIMTDYGTITTPEDRLLNNALAPCPTGWIGQDGHLIPQTQIPLVKLWLHGKEVVTLDASIVNPNWKSKRDVQQNDPLVRELLEDMGRSESLTLEFKSSLYFPPNPQDANDHYHQIREILRQLAAGANSPAHRLRLYVGLKENPDGSGASIVGVENEFQLFSKNWTHAQFLPSFLNTCKQMLGEAFLMSFKVDFITYQGHTIMRLTVDHKGDVVLFGDSKELYLRSGASMHQITDSAAYISFIRTFTKI